MTGEYVLVSVNGEPLPFRIYDSDDAAQDIVRGSISFTDTGEVDFITESANEFKLLGFTEPQIDTGAGTYTHTKDAVTVDVPESPEVPERSTATFKRAGNELILHVEDRWVWVYRRKPS